MEELCLVSCSGGLDSSTTLAILKLAGYKNIIACHFDYGCRSGAAEKIAITNICKELDIPLKIFDISNLMKSIDTTSMLMDENAKVTTGTSDDIKSTAAWVHNRNGLFMNIMAAFAEAQVFQYDYDKILLLGGWMQLSESGIYTDNSEYFTSAAMEFFKYATLIGNRLEPCYGLSDLMKFEQFALIKEFHLEQAYRHAISCDRAKVIDGVPCNCMKNGIPACGSGLLSYWGSKMVGMDDTKIRNFYEVNDPDLKILEPEHLKHEPEKYDIHAIIDRIHFPKDKLDNLHKLVNEKHKV